MIKNILCFTFLLMCTNIVMGADRGNGRSVQQQINTTRSALRANQCGQAGQNKQSRKCEELRAYLGRLQATLKTIEQQTRK